MYRITLLLLILPLLCLGCAALRFAFWLTENGPEWSNAEMWLGISIGVFFLSWTGAFLLFLRWRDRGRILKAGTALSSTPSRPDLDGTVYGLSPERQYRVVRAFTDYYGNQFEQGEILRFKERHFLPYDGGHTILFYERPLYLQEEKNEDILAHFSDYIVMVRD